MHMYTTYHLPSPSQGNIHVVAVTWGVPSDTGENSTTMWHGYTATAWLYCYCMLIHVPLPHILVHVLYVQTLYSKQSHSHQPVVNASMVCRECNERSTWDTYTSTAEEHAHDIHVPLYIRHLLCPYQPHPHLSHQC